MRPGALIAGSLLFALVAAGCIDADDGDEPNGDPVPPENGGPVEVAWGDVEDAVIRPGAPIRGGCVFNWLFTDDGGNAYIGTAAHCTSLLERLRERDTDTMVGTVVFDSDDTPGADPKLDFSLVRLDPGAVQYAHPAMLGWDGPAGVIEPAQVTVGDRLGFYGHGENFGDHEDTRARMGAVVAVDDQEYRANMPAVNGDSGAPIVHLDTDQALGMVSRFGILDVLDQEIPTTDVGPLVAWILEELHQAGFHVELATA